MSTNFFHLLSGKVILLHGKKRIGSLYQFQAHLPDKSIQPSFEAGSRALKAEAILVFTKHSVSLLSNEVLALNSSKQPSLNAYLIAQMA